jgi:hypothetical protein
LARASALLARSALLPPWLTTLVRAVALTSPVASLRGGLRGGFALTTTSALCASFAFLGLTVVFASLCGLLLALASHYGMRVSIWCYCVCDDTRGGVRPRKWSYMSPALLNLTAHGQPCHGVATSVCASFWHRRLSLDRLSASVACVHAARIVIV